jgi:hypothetical protein
LQAQSEAFSRLIDTWDEQELSFLEFAYDQNYTLSQIDSAYTIFKKNKALPSAPDEVPGSAIHTGNSYDVLNQDKHNSSVHVNNSTDDVETVSGALGSTQTPKQSVPTYKDVLLNKQGNLKNRVFQDKQVKTKENIFDNLRAKSPANVPSQVQKATSIDQDSNCHATKLESHFDSENLVLPAKLASDNLVLPLEVKSEPNSISDEKSCKPCPVSVPTVASGPAENSKNSAHQGFTNVHLGISRFSTSVTDMNTAKIKQGLTDIQL